MTEIKRNKLAVEFANPGKIVGWAVDTFSESFPLVELEYNGKKKSISKNELKERPDILSKYNFKSKKPLGFKVNLVDAFNDVLTNYSIYLNEEKVWDYESHLDALKNAPIDRGNIPTSFLGSNQVVVIYESDWFIDIVNQIGYWNSNYFNREYHSGVSYAFVNVSDVHSLDLSQNVQRIVILESKLYKHLFLHHKYLLTGADIVLLEDKINSLKDFTGLYASLKMGILASSEIENQKWDAKKFIEFLSPITKYPPLYFPKQDNLYVYHSGNSDFALTQSKYIQQVQGRLHDADLILISDQDIHSYSQLSCTQQYVLFVSSSCQKFVVDIFKFSTEEFLKEAQKRGLVIHKKVVLK